MFVAATLVFFVSVVGLSWLSVLAELLVGDDKGYANFLLMCSVVMQEFQQGGEPFGVSSQHHWFALSSINQDNQPGLSPLRHMCVCDDFGGSPPSRPPSERVRYVFG